MNDIVGIEDLPPRLLPGRTETVLPVRERRRQRADDLFKALTEGSFSFWEHVHPLFLDRDLTRHDLRELVRRGLAATRGNYQAVVRLFGMPDTRLQALPEFPRHPRLRRGLPGVPDTGAARRGGREGRVPAGGASSERRQGDPPAVEGAMSKPTFLGPLLRKGAGQCELVYAERGSVLATHVEPAFDSKTRKKGLLGRESIPDDYAMIIAPCSAVHTFSMRVPLDLLFVSKDGTITKTCRGVKPWRMAGSMGAYAVIEAAEGFIDRHEIVPGEVVALRETAHPVAAPPAAVDSADGATGGIPPRANA